jgi:pimeloyl-ACP methyl ester carboxylesterase
MMVGALVFVYGCVPLWLPPLIVSAPNRLGPPVPRVEAAPGGELPTGVTRVLAVKIEQPEAVLSVWASEPTVGPVRGTVFVLHGIRDDKRSMTGIGRRFTERGYRAVLVDLRGHGASTGRYLGYGAFEGRDLRAVADALDEQGLLASPIGAYGPSYGGAAALQWSAVDERVDAVATVATFASLHEVVPAYIDRFLPMSFLVRPAAVERTVDRAGRLAGFDPGDADTASALAVGGARVLIIHGEADDRVPVSHASLLHAAAPHRSQLWLIPDADHLNIWRGEMGARIADRAAEFLDEQLRGRQPAAARVDSPDARAAPAD